jgi:hypothetical protein
MNLFKCPLWQVIFALCHLTLVILMAWCAPRGYCAIEWMNAFNLDAYQGWDGFFRFCRELQTGAPPLQCMLELIVYQWTGSLYLISHVFYKLSLAGVYLLAVSWDDLLPRRRGEEGKQEKLRFVFTRLTSLVFLGATLIIHRLMPLTYDILFPLLGLGYLVLLPAPTVRSTTVLYRCFWAGFLLAWLELTRPFILFLFPLLASFSYLRIRPLGRKALLMFLFPILLLSGGWHLKLLIFQDGQVIWSNHTGFNLLRAWKDLGIEVPPLVDEDGTLHHPTLPEVVNTPNHSRHNQTVKNAVLRYVVQHPFKSVQFAFYRLGVFLKPRITIYNATEPEHWLLWLYRPLIWFCSSWVMWNVGRLVWGAIRRQSNLSVFGLPHNQLLVLTGASLLCLALGEAGEEARLLISILPWFAVYASYQKESARK